MDRSAKRRKVGHNTVRATMEGEIYIGTSVKDILSKVSFFHVSFLWNPGNVLHKHVSDVRLWTFGVEGNAAVAFVFKCDLTGETRRVRLEFSEPFSEEDKSYVESISRGYTQIVAHLDRLRDDLDAIVSRHGSLLGP